MVVMAIMSLMAWQGVDGIARTREANQVRLEQVLRLETIIAQWELDLASIQETSAVPTISCDGQSLRLVRRAEGGLQVVVWALRPDAATANVWQRWAGPVVTTTRNLQESWFRTQQFQGNETGQLRALSGLEDWRVFFFQGNAWANCQSTGNVVALPTAPAASGAASGAATQKVALPSGVRVVLGFAPGSGLAGSLVRDTLIAP